MPGVLREGGPRGLRGPLPYDLGQKFLIEKDKDEEVTELASPVRVSFSLGKGHVDDADHFLIAPPVQRFLAGKDKRG